MGMYSGPVLDVNHEPERDHLDAQLILVLAHQLLRVVRPVKGRPTGVVPGAGMIPPHNQVGAPMVLPDDGMPERLLRARHPHREIEQRKLDRELRVGAQKSLIAPDPREVVYVAGLGHAYDGMDQEICADLLRGPERQLLMGTVYGVSGLECDDPPPSQPCEVVTELQRRAAKLAEIVVARGLDTLDAAPYVHGVRLLQSVCGARVLRIGRTEHLLGLLHPVGTPDLFDVERRKHDALGVTKSEGGSGLESFRARFVDIQGDGNRPERSVRQPHALTHAPVIARRHESAERRKTAVHEQLEVAHLAGC